MTELKAILALHHQYYNSPDLYLIFLLLVIALELSFLISSYALLKLRNQARKRLIVLALLAICLRVGDRAVWEQLFV